MFDFKKWGLKWNDMIKKKSDFLKFDFDEN